METSLSPRQLEIAAGVAAGKTNREIAKDLFITVDTVKTHLSQIAVKTGTRNRAGMVAVLFRAGILS